MIHFLDTRIVISSIDKQIFVDIFSHNITADCRDFLRENLLLSPSLFNNLFPRICTLYAGFACLHFWRLLMACFRKLIFRQGYNSMMAWLTNCTTLVVFPSLDLLCWLEHESVLACPLSENFCFVAKIWMCLIMAHSAAVILCASLFKIGCKLQTMRFLYMHPCIPRARTNAHTARWHGFENPDIDIPGLEMASSSWTVLWASTTS